MIIFEIIARMVDSRLLKVWEVLQEKDFEWEVTPEDSNTATLEVQEYSNEVIEMVSDLLDSANVEYTIYMEG